MIGRLHQNHWSTQQCEDVIAYGKAESAEFVGDGARSTPVLELNRCPRPPQTTGQRRLNCYSEPPWRSHSRVRSPSNGLAPQYPLEVELGLDAWFPAEFSCIPLTG